MNAFYEFFAGGGMVRAGLGSGWRCLLANDSDPKKAAAYRANWGDGEMAVGDVRDISLDDLPGRADLAWASFPYQDLSLAGAGAGLKGERSSAFWPFADRLRELAEDGRAPAAVALENVTGTLVSRGGRDFHAICGALNDLGYRCGAFVADAALFLPQSRPRLFVVAVRRDLAVVGAASGPRSFWHASTIRKAHAALPDEIARSWIWWSMPRPPERGTRLEDLIDETSDEAEWDTPAETDALLSMMSRANLAKVDAAKAAGVRLAGGVYKRTRCRRGIKVQRAEVRFDGVAGCLRTPAGGSSRQIVLVVEGGGRIRSRLMSARETARLMGLPDNYVLPTSRNEAYHLTGDGVAVPVVRYIARHVIEPVLERNRECSGAKPATS